MDGVLNIYKEAGWTSFDVVAKMRGILKIKKIGHTGTLDPAATGVLPVCIGKGTKKVESFMADDKVYRAVMLLGVTTDSQDMTGEILTRSEVNLTEQDVREAIESFIGGYDQIPPMYSAKKVRGRKLVDMARKGIEVERKPRFVNIMDIGIDDMSLPRVTMTVTCSKGTYIRTLCHDIGQKLGCGAAMESLIRTRVGRFKIEDAVTLDDLQKLADEDRLEEVVITDIF
ncbi:MAG: tRNA pseudouridine(55) synthase TruB [Lachnospiraceae bacterium]|nr:tRNA pseudouridine(55) synthase TruB [Candidatus Darwinimomas equi]